MNRKRVLTAAAIGLAVCVMWTLRRDIVLAQSQGNIQAPKFQYDPTFPQPLPEKWAIGAIGGMAVDSHDHIWVLHRPGPLQKNERFAGAGMTPPRADCCIPAPPVLEFDAAGNRGRNKRQAKTDKPARGHSDYSILTVAGNNLS